MMSLASFTSSTFQFHKGTIRTNTAPGIAGDISRFQFHKGTIRTDVECNENGRMEISIP